MKNDTNRRQLVGIILIALILVVVTSIGIRTILEKEDIPEVLTDKAGDILEMDENAEQGGLVYRSQEEIQEELNQKVREGMINISMNTSPVFENSHAKGNLMIVNNEVNNYPQIVYIVLKDSGKEIYRSKGIPVGSKIEYAALDVELAPGSYDCVAYFNNMDPQTGSILGTAGAEIVITVLG